MTTKYNVRLIREGKEQILTLPSELSFNSDEVTIFKKNHQLIIESREKQSLLETLASLDDINEDFPDVDENLLPLDNIDLLLFHRSK